MSAGFRARVPFQIVAEVNIVVGSDRRRMGYVHCQTRGADVDVDRSGARHIALVGSAQVTPGRRAR